MADPPPVDKAPVARSFSFVGGVGPLSGVNVVFYSVCDFSTRLREFKEAQSLQAAGAQVTFVGHGSHAATHLAAGAVPLVLLDPADRRMVAPGDTTWGRIANATVLRARRGLWRATRGRAQLKATVAALDPHVIHAVDAPSLPGAAALASAHGSKLVYDAHEYWPGFVTNPALAGNRQWADRQLAAEQRFAPTAHLVLTTSEDMSEQLRARYQLRETQVLFNAIWSMGATLEEAKRPVRFVFHGSVSAGRNVDGMLEALSLLDGEWTLDIHGELHGMSPVDLDSIAKRHGVSDRVTYHGAFDYDALPQVLPGHDIELYCAQRLDGNFDVTLPNKLFDAIVAGVAVAMPDFASVKRIVEREGVGVVFDSSSPQAIAATLQPLVSDPAAVTRLKQRSVEAAPRYAWEAQGAKLVEAYARMLGVTDRSDSEE